MTGDRWTGMRAGALVAAALWACGAEEPDRVDAPDPGVELPLESRDGPGPIWPPTCGAEPAADPDVPPPELATLHLGTPSVRGALSPESVQTVVGGHAATLRYCYQRVLRDDPELRGEVVLTITIARDGAVASASLPHLDIGAPEDLTHCIVGRAHKMRFPSPEDGGVAVAQVPLTFSPT